jgi:phage-related protein
LIQFLVSCRHEGIEFLGASLDDLRAFPAIARRLCGFELSKVQEGREPSDWKPMTTVGQGVREIRVRERSGAYRVIYVAALKDAIFVLHCFAKKSAKTTREDLDIAKTRYKDLMRRIE